MAGDDPGDHVSEVGVRLDAVELACLDQRSDRCPMLGAPVGAGEERILAVQRNGADGALDDVGVDLDRTVVEESCQTLPTRERVADSFRQLGLLADKGELLPKPRLKGIDDGTASLLPDGAAFVAERPRISLSTW